MLGFKADKDIKSMSYLPPLLWLNITEKVCIKEESKSRHLSPARQKSTLAAKHTIIQLHLCTNQNVGAILTWYYNLDEKLARLSMMKIKAKLIKQSKRDFYYHHYILMDICMMKILIEGAHSL